MLFVDDEKYMLGISITTISIAIECQFLTAYLFKVAFKLTPCVRGESDGRGENRNSISRNLFALNDSANVEVSRGELGKNLASDYSAPNSGESK